MKNNLLHCSIHSKSIIMLGLSYSMNYTESPLRSNESSRIIEEDKIEEYKNERKKIEEYFTQKPSMMSRINQLNPQEHTNILNNRLENENISFCEKRISESI